MTKLVAGAARGAGFRYTGECFYCGRTLVCAVPLSFQKMEALWDGQLTCGPCVHIEGLPPWRPTKASAARRERARAKWLARKAAA